jgi:hypothetical protein
MPGGHLPLDQKQRDPSYGIGLYIRMGGQPSAERLSLRVFAAACHTLTAKSHFPAFGLYKDSARHSGHAA